MRYFSKLVNYCHGFLDDLVNLMGNLKGMEKKTNRKRRKCVDSSREHILSREKF